MEGPTDLVFSTTSIHGLQQIGRKGSVLKAFWWCCFVLVSISLMILQCSQVTNKLLSYPKDAVQQVFGGILTFPAVTICSLGLVKKSAEIALEAISKGYTHGTFTESSSTVLSQLAGTTSTTTVTTSSSLQCQQDVCMYWEPFCFIDLFWVADSWTDGAGLCQSYGGSLITFPSSNYSTFARFTEYIIARNRTDWQWTDYRNPADHNSSYCGIWLDSYGRQAPGFVKFSVGFPTGLNKTAMAFNMIVGGVHFWDDYETTGKRLICMCHCPAITPPINGFIVGDQFTDLTMSIGFGCSANYQLVGSSIITCIYVVGLGVQWSASPPQCMADCTAIISQTFLISYNNTDTRIKSGTLATFSCLPGMYLYGRSNSTCLNGTWVVDTAGYPMCSAITDVSVQQFLDYAGSTPKPNTLSASSAFYGLLPYILSSLTDAQMEIIGFNETNMIVSCTFNQRDCEKLDVASKRDSQNGMCYTFNHKNMLQYYTVERSGETTGLKLLLFSLQGEYLSIVTSGGLKMFVHDQNDPIFYGHNGFMLSPGLTYSIALQKAMEIRQNTPNDLCVEDVQQVQFYNFHNSTYFQEACISSYIQTQIASNCSCNSPTLPAKDNKTPICGVVQQSCVQQVYNDSDNLVSNAKLFCPPRCSYTYYKRTSTSWQSKATVAATMKLNISKEEYLRNTVDVSMFFQTLDVVNLVEVASYTVINLLSDLGATMGVLVGMSVISWVEFIYAVGQCAKVLLQKCIRKFA